MKYKVHIPTEQYGFVEVDDISSIAELSNTYNQVKQKFREGEGHNQKEWAKVRDTYVNTGEITQEDYEKCSKLQKYFINEIKLVIKRNNHGT